MFFSRNYYTNNLNLNLENKYNIILKHEYKNQEY